MNMRDEKWGVIANPYSGTRQLRTDWAKIVRLLKRAEIEFDHRATEYAGHAVELARKFVEDGVKNILVVGGDGTLNEVVNGIFTADVDDRSDVSLALIPYGTGNDWARYWGLLKSRRKMSERLYDREKVKIDVGYLDYTKNGEPHRQYFINGVGFGFDAKVCELTNRLKQKIGGNSMVYTLCLILAVFNFKSEVMTLTSDNETIEEDIFTISVGNGCYSGGGLKQTPDSDPTDGVFNITSIKRPTVMKILFGLKELFAGRLDKHPLAIPFVTKKFEVKTSPNILIETDGVLINGDGDYKISIIHNAISMIV